MPKYIVLLIFASFPFGASAQQCGCKEKFQFVRTQIEKNYAGFSDKVTQKNRQAYTTFTNNYMTRIKQTEKPAYCFQLISEWLKYFRDGHIQPYAPTDEVDSVALLDRIKKTEVYIISPEKMGQLKNSTTLEGVYVHEDSTYTVGILKNKNQFRDYIGVIVNSKTDLWKPGQVKFEIKEKKNGMYSVLLYMRDHSYRQQNWKFDGASLNGNEWIKTGGRKIATKAKNEREFHTVFAKKMDDRTLYIQIGTFDASNARAIDSVFKANEPLLKSTPNLILDLRGNGGGADFAYSPIIPYLYTQPLIGIGVDVLATEDNIKGWKKLLSDPDIPEKTKTGLREVIDSMEKHTGEFVNSADDDTLTMDKVRPYPKKIAVLIDGGGASTTEQFLLVARQSRKVTLMGQHTYGALDYSNMRETESPCKDIGLYFATTRSRRIKKGQAIDNIGIKPNVLLSEDKDWVQEAKKYVER